MHEDWIGAEVSLRLRIQMNSEQQTSPDSEMMCHKITGSMTSPWTIIWKDPEKKSLVLKVNWPEEDLLTQNQTLSNFKSVLVNILSIGLQFSSVALLCPTLWDPMNRSTPGLPVHRQLPEFTQTHVHQVGDTIQPSHPLSSPSLPAPNPSQHQGLFQQVNSLHEVSKVLEFQPQPQSFQWTPKTGLL